MKSIAPAIARALSLTAVILIWIGLGRWWTLTTITKPLNGWCGPDYDGYYLSDCVAEPTYWNVGSAADVDNWLIGLLLSALTLAVLFAAACVLYHVARWIIFGSSSDEPTCEVAACKCCCHEGEEYDSDSGAWIATNAAVIAASAAIISST